MQSEVKEEPSENKGVQVIARAAEILRALIGQPQGLSLSQIAREVGLARSTVHRIITALEAEHFVIPYSSNGGIRLGPGLVPLAASVHVPHHHSFLPADPHFVRVLSPYLRRDDQLCAQIPFFLLEVFGTLFLSKQLFHEARFRKLIILLMKRVNPEPFRNREVDVTAVLFGNCKTCE